MGDEAEHANEVEAMVTKPSEVGDEHKILERATTVFKRVDLLWCLLGARVLLKIITSFFLHSAGSCKTILLTVVSWKERLPPHPRISQKSESVD